MEQMPLGTHIVLEFYGCNPETLKHPDSVQRAFHEAARLARCTIVTEEYHHFQPHGVSGVTVIQESHFSAHTWPEHSYAAIDVFYCGEKPEIELGIAHLIEAFKPKFVERHTMNRGNMPTISAYSPETAEIGG